MLFLDHYSVSGVVSGSSIRGFWIFNICGSGQLRYCCRPLKVNVFYLYSKHVLGYVKVSVKTVSLRVTQPNFDHLLDSTTSIHFIPMVEFRWYKMYRGGQI